MGYFLGVLFIAAGIVGLGIKEYFTTQVLLSWILIAVGSIPFVVTLLILVGGLIVALAASR